MGKCQNRYVWSAVLGAVIALLVGGSVACAAKEPTPSPPTPTVPIPTLVYPTVPAPAAAVTPTPIQAKEPGLPPFFAGKPVYGGTLRVADTGIQTLVPGFAQSFGARGQLFAICDTLIRTYPDFSLHPLLAESWSVSPDGKTVTLHLRKGVKFHDGTDFNARVVKWNLELNLDYKNAPVLDPIVKGVPPYLSIGPFVEAVQVVDDYSVTIRLRRPFRPILPYLADIQGFAMVSQTAVEKLGADFGRRPVCAGPFKFVQWTLDRDMKVVRYENYWDKGKPYLDGITWQFLPDDSVRVAMLRTGETDVLGGQGGNLRPQFVDIVKSHPSLKVISYKSANFDFLAIRVVQEPWTNKALREALAHSFNRQAFINALYEGAGRPAYSSEGDNLWWSDPSVNMYPYDIQKAKQKMVEAGYPQGLTTTFGCDKAVHQVQRCEFIQFMYKEIGINFTINIHENAYLDALRGKIPIYNAGNGGWGPREDPDTRLRTLFHSTGGNAQITMYNNPEVDRMLDLAVGAFDQAEAKKLYSEVIRITAKDLSVIPILLRTLYIGMRKEVQNFHWYPNVYPRYRDMWFEK